jgi:CRISPR-associated protein Csm4
MPADWSKWQDWRFRLRLQAPLVTPMQSDIVFGHICWQIALQAGNSGVAAFLAPFLAGQPPFVLSEAFPAGLLPQPLFPQNPAPAASQEEYIARKRRKKDGFLLAEDFRVLCAQADYAPDPQPNPWQSREVLHAAIDRRLGATGGENSAGQLYASSQSWLEDRKGLSDNAGEAGQLCASNQSRLSPRQELDIYARALEGYGPRLEQWLQQIGSSGFGRDKSSGQGRFSLEGREETQNLRAASAGQGLVVLSTYMPAASDPLAGYWRLRVKRGRLGENAGSGNPFKKTLLQIEPGAVFHSPQARPWLGRMVRGISNAMPEAVQCGLAITSRCVWPEDA